MDAEDEVIITKETRIYSKGEFLVNARKYFFIGFDIKRGELFGEVYEEGFAGWVASAFNKEATDGFIFELKEAVVIEVEVF